MAPSLHDFATFDTPDTGGGSATMWGRALRAALQRSDTAGIAEALANGAELDSADNGPVLHRLIGLGDANLVGQALSLGADPNGVDDSPQALTPLHQAVWYDRPVLVRLLLEQGADPTRVAFDGEDPDSTCFEARPLHLAAERASPRVMGLLLEADPAGVLVRDGWGRTPLHLAMLHPHARHRDVARRPNLLVAALLDAGADPDARACKGPHPLNRAGMGSTPLHEAAYHCLAVVVQQLLDAGADPMRLNVMGETPLDVARRRGPPAMGAMSALERAMLKRSVDDEDSGGTARAQRRL